MQSSVPIIAGAGGPTRQAIEQAKEAERLEHTVFC